MRTTRRTSGLASLLLLVLLPVGVARAQEDGAAGLPVPQEDPPTLDGRLADGEWRNAGTFTVGRGEDVYGRGHLLRAGHNLYLGYRSEFAGLSLGLRFHFFDPAARTKIAVLVAPLQLPLPPLSVFREGEDRIPERMPAVTADARFDLTAEDGFTCELRLPYDLVGIRPEGSGYAFSAEVWDLQSNRILGLFPTGLQGPLVGASQIRLVAAGGWGAGGEPDPSPAHPAIELLERIAVEAEPAPEGFEPLQVLQAFTGLEDGRRQDAPLAALQEQVRGLVEAYPDYALLRTTLIRVLRARNDHEGALAAQAALLRDFPIVQYDVRTVLTTLDLMVGAGHFGEALDYVVARAGMLRDLEGSADIPRSLEGLRDDLVLEEELRRRDAERDDLPRVRLVTDKGPILVELFEDDAPNHVANFIALVEAGFYDGTRFHWVAGGDRVVGGDPNSRDEEPANDGYGDPGYLIETDPGRRMPFAFTISYSDKREQRRSEGSSFMIHIAPDTEMVAFHTVFGRVLEGEDVVRRLEYYDMLETAKVVRKRAHAYVPVKRPVSD